MKRQHASTLLCTASILAFLSIFSIASAQPEIHVDPNSFEIDIDPIAEVEQVTFTISNTGNEDLVWTSNEEIIREPRQAGPRRDNAGDLLGEIEGFNVQNEYCSPVAWDWDNERMWVTNYNRSIAVAYSHDANYQNFQEEARVNVGNCMDGAWVDGLFYCGVLGNRAVNRYDSDGQNIGAQDFPWQVYGIAADVEEELLFVLSGNDWTIHVYPLNGQGGIGEEIGAIRNHMQFHNNEIAYGLEWVPKHSDGQLWMTAALQGRTYQMRLTRTIGLVPKPFKALSCSKAALPKHILRSPTMVITSGRAAIQKKPSESMTTASLRHTG